jgi:hypothetical protein
MFGGGRRQRRPVCISCDFFGVTRWYAPCETPGVPAGSNARDHVCHWDSIPSARNPKIRTVVWICEYPYRTMRLSGPDEDCEDCPHRLPAQADAPEQPGQDEPIRRPGALGAEPGTTGFAGAAGAAGVETRLLQFALARQS